MKPLLSMVICLIGLAAAGAEDRSVELLNGKDLSGWKLKGDASGSYWTVGRATLDRDDPSRFMVEKGTELVNDKGHQDRGRGVDIFSDAKHGSARIEVELMVSQGSNSGVYVQGEYEVQVFDSWGVDKPRTVDIGAIYGAAPPRSNAAKKPGAWQRMVIDFQAPRFGPDGHVVRKARFVKIVLNGVTIQENVEMDGVTPGGLTGKEHAMGPLLLQGNHGPVSYRNLKITPMAF